MSIPAAQYPFHDWSAMVTHCGRVCYRGQMVNVSQAFAGQLVGVRQVGERIWLEPIANPFQPAVLPMSPE